jgi:hypothetical protein
MPKALDNDVWVVAPTGGLLPALLIVADHAVAWFVPAVTDEFDAKFKRLVYAVVILELSVDK